MLTVIAGLFMIGGLVIVHEAGHYVVARLFKIGTPVFSIGMGPRIFGFHFWETDFRISALPIGGYVRMAGADAFGEEDADTDWHDPSEDFMRRPVWQRLLVMLAGPAANLVLPFLLFTAAFMFGRPMEDATVQRVMPGSQAEEAGVEASDRIVAVDGSQVRNWREVQAALVEREGVPDVSLTVQRAGSTLDLQVDGPAEGGVYGLGLSHFAISSRVGVSDAASPAWRAGIRTGDAIERVDGTPVSTLMELREAMTPGASHTVSVQRAVPDPSDPTNEKKRIKKPFEFTVSPDAAWTPAEDEAMPDVWGFLPLEVFVSNVVLDPPSAALQAGVKPGDRMVSIDGSPIRAWQDVVDLVRASADDLTLEQAKVQNRGCSFGGEPTVYGRPLSLEISRGGERQVLEFRPQVQRIVYGTEVSYRPIMGVRPYLQTSVPGPREAASYSLTEAFPLAVEDSENTVRQIVAALGGLIQGELRPDETLGGPVEIFRTAGQAARQGFHQYIVWMGMISFSLGILNLLPVPVLDGGQILFYTIEGIRGRPLPLALRERVQMLGVLFLGALMVVVFVNDIGRWLQG